MGHWEQTGKENRDARKESAKRYKPHEVLAAARAALH